MGARQRVAKLARQPSSRILRLVRASGGGAWLRRSGSINFAPRRRAADAHPVKMLSKDVERCFRYQVMDNRRCCRQRVLDRESCRDRTCLRMPANASSKVVAWMPRNGQRLARGEMERTGLAWKRRGALCDERGMVIRGYPCGKTPHLPSLRCSSARHARRPRFSTGLTSREGS